MLCRELLTTCPQVSKMVLSAWLSKAARATLAALVFGEVVSALIVAPP